MNEGMSEKMNTKNERMMFEQMKNNHNNFNDIKKSQFELNETNRLKIKNFYGKNL